MAEEQTIQKVDKLGFFEIKNFCPLNDIVKEMKRKTTDWKKLFAKCTADGRLISRTSPPQIKYGQMICTDPLPMKIHRWQIST